MCGLGWAQTAGNTAQDSDLQAQIQELKAKLATLETKVEQNQKAQEQAKKEQAAASVTTFPGDKLKIDGRLFTGLLDSGQQGKYTHWSGDVPDAKIRFTWTPSKNVTVVNRLNLNLSNSGNNPTFDYMYVDLAEMLLPTNTVRIGQRKLDVGQETWVDNPIENMLVSNSISHIGGYGTGVALRGKFMNTATAPTYEMGFINGPQGLTVRPTSGLPYNIKIAAPFCGNLFASGTYYNSGTMLGANSSAVKVAEISSSPTGATHWRRSLWEADLRYNYGATGILPFEPFGKIPPVMLGATYGASDDSVMGAGDRNGHYWFVEGMARINDKLYSAARYSVFDLSDGVKAKLGDSPVAVNSYKRTSLGLGYALSDLVILKTEYSWNCTGGTVVQPRLNQASFGVATRF